MWGSKPKWLLLVLFLLSDKVHTQAPPTPSLKNSHGPITSGLGVSPLPSLLPLMTINQETEQEPKEKIRGEPNTDSAHHLISALKASLHGQVHLHGNLSCAELVAAPWIGEGFAQVLLGLVIVPVLVSGGCVFEAQLLVVKLYALLGEDDTQALLEDVVALMRRGREMPLHISSTPPTLRAQSHRHLQAVMFNIHQLVKAGQKVGVLLNSGQEKYCQGWLRVKGAHLLGLMANHGEHLYLKEAKKVCKRLGHDCAGVIHEGKRYLVILRSGSRIVPLASPGQSESWIQQCGVGSVRWRRNAAPQYDCKNEKEKRVHNVVEWIPAVSTLYNLGTAVYYASVNCSSTAKERAILTAVDLGTDALMATTGGTAGVAVYALGSGLKTGVKVGLKYLLNSMNQEHDLLMNQNSWENGTITSK
ncbi:uncharacterized protein apof [Electrophorus electricus]|uniref:Apolipoprotein F n=1 Tax=Electrophorus electricus TaxID=8005 RepID=A0A4W4EBB8_ELEEL|nr:uncharacterized protein apof [Electrophorus electricus]